MIHRRLAQTLDVSIAITQSMATTVSIARVITAIVSMAIVSIVVTVSIVIIASIAIVSIAIGGDPPLLTMAPIYYGDQVTRTREAIRHRRGMWAHGVPGFVLTSLHSADEDPTRDVHYNRMVSTRDGHSEPWMHTDRYPECSWQCATEIQADETRVYAFARSLRADRRPRGDRRQHGEPRLRRDLRRDQRQWCDPRPVFEEPQVVRRIKYGRQHT